MSNSFSDFHENLVWETREKPAHAVTSCFCSHILRSRVRKISLFINYSGCSLSHTNNVLALQFSLFTFLAFSSRRYSLVREEEYVVARSMIQMIFARREKNPREKSTYGGIFSPAEMQTFSIFLSSWADAKGNVKKFCFNIKGFAEYINSKRCSSELLIELSVYFAWLIGD